MILTVPTTWTPRPPSPRPPPPARPMDAERLVGDRRAMLRHAVEVLLRALDALLDRDGDLIGLPVADPHHLALIADHHQCGEREAPAALDDLRDPVDLDDALLE